MEIYQVGGSLRDELMGNSAHDHDYVLIGCSEKEFLRRFPGAKRVGQRKSVYIVNGNEYTLSRAADIQADLQERDLTINAIARSSRGDLFTHPLSLMDLEHKLLRPIAIQNFFDDPLRVFRAARFKACLPEFGVHPTLVEVMRSVGKQGMLKTVAAERVGNEVIKACGCRQPGHFLKLLTETDTLTPWFEELTGADAVPAGPAPYHSSSLLDHNIQLMDKLAGSPLRVWMGLCHDLGKSGTDKLKWPRHHGHDLIGESLAARLGDRLRLPARFIKAGMAAARWHMVAGNYPRLKSGTKVKLLIHLHRNRLLTEMFELVWADRGLDYRKEVQFDCQSILSVHLPPEHRGRGHHSGQMLHELRCQVLKRR